MLIRVNSCFMDSRHCAYIVLTAVTVRTPLQHANMTAISNRDRLPPGIVLLPDKKIQSQSVPNYVCTMTVFSS